MSSTEGGALVAKPAGADGAKPVLFLHIPKTAGTSFLLMLQNTFGDSRVRRIQKIDEHIQETIKTILAAEMVTYRA